TSSALKTPGRNRYPSRSNSSSCAWLRRIVPSLSVFRDYSAKKGEWDGRGQAEHVGAEVPEARRRHVAARDRERGPRQGGGRRPTLQGEDGADGRRARASPRDRRRDRDL